MTNAPARLPLTLPLERDGVLCREGQNYDEAVIVCITARVGSTAFMSALARLIGAEELPEIFNPRSPFDLLQERYQARSLQDFVNRYHAESGGGSRVWFKTNYFDMTGMLKADGISRLFPRRRLIQIVRRDVVAQAYSLWKANKYNLWHARSEAAREEVGTIALDSEDLLKIARSVGNLWRERCLWEQWFRQNPGHPVLSLAYEDIASDLDAQVRRAWRFATGKDAPVGPIGSDYVRTSNDADGENVEKVRRALAAA